MVSMTFEEYDNLEERILQLPDDVEISRDFSQAELEQLFVTFVNPDPVTGHAPLAVPFLIYLQNNIDSTFRQTSKNIDAILRKYLILEG